MRMSSFDFTDKTVIVTGGGTGIGFEIANSFVSCGAKVTIVGRRKDALEKALLQMKKKIPKSEDNIISLTCDMSNEQSVSDLFQTVQSTFNTIDILINNCGTWSLGSINELKDSEIDAHFNNILKSTILGTKFASAYLGESGVIINVGSFAGVLPMKNASIYSSFKSAINVFTKSSAKEFGKSGSDVNLLFQQINSFKEFLKSREIFFSDLENEPICFKRLGISFGPTTIITTITVSAISDQPKENIEIICLRQSFFQYFHLSFLHHSCHV